MNSDKREALRLKCKSDVRNVMLRTEELLELLGESEAKEQYEAQTIARTPDMPTNAVAWEKVEGYGDGHPMWWCLKGAELLAYPGAPDLMPDTPPPLYRAIVDLGRE